MRLFLDTNVVLDVLADREPFAKEAAIVLSIIERGEAEGLIAAHTVTTLYYLLQRSVGRPKANKALRDVLRLVQVVAVDRDRLGEALAMAWKDFVDAVQAACAAKAEVDYFVTRNPADFTRSGLEVVTPSQLLAALRQA